MKRFHVHIDVDDLGKSIAFYLTSSHDYQRTDPLYPQLRA